MSMSSATVRQFSAVDTPVLPAPDSTIFHQLGTSWHQLHPNIQARFAHDPALGTQVVYAGIMQTIRRSRMGWLFAHLTRIIGNPLTPHAGHDVPMEVALFKKTGINGVHWQRTYHYPHRRPFVVTSIKRESSQGDLMECVGGGFGMILRLTAENTKLHFISTRYFWQVRGWRVPLPHWLSPGKTHVIHEDRGNGTFRFSITMLHRQLGETFYQDGIFYAKMPQE